MKKIFLSELLKTKRYSFLYLIIFLPFLIVLVFFINFYNLSLEEFHDKLYGGDDSNPWYYYYKTLLLIVAFSLPLITSVLTFIIKHLEDKANGWKVLLALPKPIINLYFSKFLVVVIYLLLYQALVLLFIIFSSFTLSYLKPEFDFQSYPNYVGFLINLFIKYFYISIAVASLTYCFLLFIRKSVVSLLLSIFLPLIGMFFTYPINLYSNAIDITFLPRQLRARYIIDNGSANGFSMNVSSEYDFFLLGWVIISWLLIYLQSKRPVTSYH